MVRRKSRNTAGSPEVDPDSDEPDVDEAPNGAMEVPVSVIDAARAIGLDPTDPELAGTIEEDKVLAMLDELADADAENEDLFREGATRARLARSAGVEEVSAESWFGRTGEERATQLRYRSEMADIFLDLAIDVGLRRRATVTV